MNRADFYAYLRKRDSGIFGTSLSQRQVDGTEAILDAADGLPIEHVAYHLATPYLETGRKMAANVESMNYSVNGLLKTFGRHRISQADAERLGRSGSRPAQQREIANTVYGGEWGRKNLGNTQTDDGWRFRGHGMVHLTGRRNFSVASTRLGVDMINNPHLALNNETAAECLVIGCEEGWFTGKKLSDYLPGDYVQARRVVNGLDRAAEIAGYARAFEAALRAGGYHPTILLKPTKPSVPPEPSAPPAPEVPDPQPGFWGRLWRDLRAYLGA